MVTVNERIDEFERFVIEWSLENVNGKTDGTSNLDKRQM